MSLVFTEFRCSREKIKYIYKKKIPWIISITHERKGNFCPVAPVIKKAAGAADPTAPVDPAPLIGGRIDATLYSIHVIWEVNEREKNINTVKVQDSERSIL